MKRLVGLVVALASLTGCPGTKEDPFGVTKDPHQVAHLDKAKKPVPPLVSHLVATVTDGTLGPFLARSPNGGSLAVYASRVPPLGRQIVTVPLDDRLVPKARPRLTAAVNGEVDAIIARPVAKGYAIAWTVVADNGGSALRILELDGDGIAHGEPFDVARSDKEIVWFEITPTSRGAVCTWAEQSSKTEANILALALDETAHAHGVPSQAVKGVVGWQAVATSRGVALAVRNAAGAITIHEVDPDAQPLGPPMSVVTKGAGTDFDVVRVESPGKKGAYVFAWTDTSELDTAVSSVWVADGAPPSAPFHVSDDVGGAALTSIAAAKGNVFVAWEETGRRLTGGRRLHVSSVAPGAVTASTAVDVYGGSSELTADGTGVALLATTRVCAVKETDDACAKEAPAPALLRFDAALKPVAVSPIVVPETQQAALAWGADCTDKGCAALVASGETPTPVFVFDASAVKAASRLALPPEPPKEAPRATSLMTVASNDSIADFSAAKIGAISLVATMRTGVDDPKSSAVQKTTGATIDLRAVPANGVASPPVTLTTRALDTGGVAIAAADTEAGGALVAWVAKDGGDPQVHVARVDAHGKKLNETLVTTERGDAADVAVAWSSGGWLVAWVDWRDGNGEVYLSRLAPDASRVVSTERITKAPGDASDVTILVPKGSVDAWLAWADPRENPKEGFSDIYVAKAHVKDGKKVGDETRVLATAAHSRSPSLAPFDDTVAIAWIEEAPLGEGTSDAHFGTTTASYGAMLAKLDAEGKPVGEPMRTRGAGEGFPTSIALTNDDGVLRAAAARAQEDAVVLDLLQWPGRGPVRAYPLVKLDGPPSMDVALAISGGTIFFDDEALPSQGGDWRVRKLAISRGK